MADSRYLDGDPAQSQDLSDYVAATAQAFALIADLLQEGRAEDAACHAQTEARRAYSLLRSLEKARLPEVDVPRTLDTSRRSLWRYKGE